MNTFHQTPRFILHITDVEGSQTFFTTLKKSTIVNFHPNKGLFFHPAIKNPYFIFGGDATDRGVHDLEITALLLDFKQRHPNNVFLIAGNREIKNNRFKVELDPRLIRERLLHTDSPRWLSARTVPLDYVKANLQIKKIPIDTNDHHALQNYIHSLSVEECQLIYLHWMLEKTMGSPHTFRYRREELQKNTSKKITDMDVLNNYLDIMSPNGLMGQYLQHAQIGVIIPDTCIMAVHGGLTDDNIGRLSDTSDNIEPIQDAHQWIDAWNTWYQEQIQHWSHFQPDRLTVPACTELDESVIPLPGKHKTIITADMLTPERHFQPIPAKVSAYLKQNQLQIVLTGHQPSGDHPAMLRDDKNAILFINGDTGYAKINPPSPDETRGKANHVLEMTATKTETHVHIAATLAEGEIVNTDICIKPDLIEGNGYIGKVLQDGRFVQCHLPDNHYRLIEQTGFKYTFSLVSQLELEALFKNENEQRQSTESKRA